jgi:hypothetical protein
MDNSLLKGIAVAAIAWLVASGAASAQSIQSRQCSNATLRGNYALRSRAKPSASWVHQISFWRLRSRWTG